MRNKKGRLFLGAFLASLLLIFIYASTSFARDIIIQKPYSPAVKWCKDHVEDVEKCSDSKFLFQLGIKSKGAIFYDQRNYRGSQFRGNYGYGDSRLGSFDNKISSIEVQSCTVVKIFEHVSYKGRSRTLTNSTGSSNRYMLSNLENRVSSIQVFPYLSESGSCAVVIPFKKLTNPGAEAGTTEQWTTNGPVNVKTDHAGLKAHGGEKFFSFSRSDQPAKSASMYQDVDCPNKTRFRISGWYATDSKDTGEVWLTFYDANHNEISEAGGWNLTPSRQVWKKFEYRGQVPSGTVKARVLFRGTRKAGSHTDVHFDDLDFQCY